MFVTMIIVKKKNNKGIKLVLLDSLFKQFKSLQVEFQCTQMNRTVVNNNQI